MPLDNTASIGDIITKLNEMQMLNEKADLASLIGSPALSTDSIATLLNLIQTQKNNMATYLTNKGRSASGTETIPVLVDKINSIPSKRVASGNGTSAPSGVVTVNTLTFQPSLVIVFGKFINTSDANRWHHRGAIYNPSQTIITHATYDNFKYDYDNSNYSETHNYYEYIDSTNITLSSNGFTYNTGYSFDGANGTTYTWLAIE